MDIVSKKWNVFDVLEIQGRIDGLTAANLKRAVDQEAVDGRRNLVLDFRHITYMSSAGLRVILQSHKALKQIGGELTLVSVPPAIMEIFNISGMAGFLRILPDLKDLLTASKSREDAVEVIEVNLDGINFEWRKASIRKGQLFAFGSEEKLITSSYTPADQVVFKPAEIAYGAGLGALGEDYSDFKSLFGESVVIGHHFFSYPAVARPVVDYAYFAQQSQHSLNFLYGFGFNGEFARILRFDVSHNPLSIGELVNAAGKAVESGLFGVVILGISGGMQGMHLKKSPIPENQPKNGKILDAENFSHWMNFSLESEEINKTVVACGVVAKTPGAAGPDFGRIMPETGGMHLHAAIFENGLWSNNIMEFEDELQRVLKEFEPQKVLHVLPDSKLKNGYIAIINLEEN